MTHDLAALAPAHCTLCPRRCGADRTVQQGLCGGGAQIKLARAALHLWEEPCLSGVAAQAVCAPALGDAVSPEESAKHGSAQCSLANAAEEPTARGSGTVFFSGCPLGCCYCQNYRISAQNEGVAVSLERLAAIFLELQAQGAYNLNLVSATQYLPWVLAALRLARPALHIPVVYNTGGYETPEALAALDGFVDIYLTDIKYVSPALSALYSGAEDYFAVASAAARTMLSQTGSPRFDADGMLQRGTIIRHLALPGAVADSKAVLDFLATLPRGGFLTSLMSQYTPCYKARTDARYKALARRISTWEYRQVVNYAVDLGLTDGYMQEKSSAREEYTPAFDGEGVLSSMGLKLNPSL